MKRLVFLAVIAVLLAGPFGPSALAAPGDGNTGGTEGGAMAVDIFAARPLGLASTVFGAATFVVSLPFSALGHNVGPAYEALIVSPARYTFDRPLGEFD
ncbi:MAG: hypothetical protein K9J79_06355 [Desulfobacteraceae bacterium]|nr:hypothetical protein [Desulfobacteraceae bacterium]MCF8094968.1 hypothetical protein [Desulfobacteraceae bacterium]